MGLCQNCKYIAQAKSQLAIKTVFYCFEKEGQEGLYSEIKSPEIDSCINFKKYVTTED